MLPVSLYKHVMRPLLFRLPPERAHDLTRGLLSDAQRSEMVRALVRDQYQYEHPALETEVFGLRYPNPVGIAAGFDKNCEILPILSDLGFGFIHGGTVTPRPQHGNPKPRMFRLPEDGGLINRMGLPNHGADRVADRLYRTTLPSVPIAIHVDKMNDSAPVEALDDYRDAFETMYPHGDYFVVGFCPNTPDTFEKTAIEYMDDVFGVIAESNVEGKPVLVRAGRKDPDEDRIASIVDLVEGHDLDGFVLGTPKRAASGLTSPARNEEGNVTGRPVQSKGTELVRKFHRQTDLPIVATGGVDSAVSAFEKIRAGASLVKLYTGFVYQGPATARTINAGLVKLLKAEGYESIEEAVGTAVDASPQA